MDPTKRMQFLPIAVPWHLPRTLLRFFGILEVGNKKITEKPFMSSICLSASICKWIGSRQTNHANGAPERRGLLFGRMSRAPRDLSQISRLASCRSPASEIIFAASASPSDRMTSKRQVARALTLKPASMRCLLNYDLRTLEALPFSFAMGQFKQAVEIDRGFVMCTQSCMARHGSQCVPYLSNLSVRSLNHKP